MGKRLPDHELLTELACEELDRRDIIGRIWRRDHTVWKPSPYEIADRLGWLDVSSEMRTTASTLRRFADEVRADGFERVVLLGMGGSSLGPEALARTFGSAYGFPELRVLDSVLPSEIRAVSRSLDPLRTLFVVSSKSGTTVETNALYRHFRREVETFAWVPRNGWPPLRGHHGPRNSIDKTSRSRRLPAGVSESAGHWRAVLGAVARWAGAGGADGAGNRGCARSGRRHGGPLLGHTRRERQSRRTARSGNRRAGRAGAGQADVAGVAVGGGVRAVGGATRGGEPGQGGQGRRAGGRRAAHAVGTPRR